MSETDYQIEISVGDIVEGEKYSQGIGVVTCVDPSIETIFLIEEDGNTHFSPGGTFNGRLRKLGSMGLDEVVDGWSKYYEKIGLNYTDDKKEALMNRLKEQQLKGPVLRPLWPEAETS